MKAKDIMSKGRPEVYLDLDGVVADFFDKYAELAIIHLMMEKYNKSEKEAFQIYHQDEEKWQKEFGIRSYRDIPPAKGDPVLNMMVGTNFFNRLPKFPTADTLTNYLAKTFGSYKVLSSPLRGDYENSEKWKKEWVARQLSPPPTVVIIEHRKEKYAKQPDGTPNILIDDRGNNITNWEAKGGIGIKYQADEDSLDKVYNGIERAFRIIKGDEEHVPQVLKSKDRTKTIATGDDEKPKVDQPEPVKENAEEAKANFVAIFKKFLPLAMKVLDIKTLPTMKFEVSVEDESQPTFGRFDPDNNELTVALANRHPNDILRTVAHELVHYRQGLQHKLDDYSGETGSDEENEANALAGVIMRHFNKQHPEFLKQKPLMLGDLNERRKRKKRRWAAYGPGPYGWYGYDATYSGDAGEGDGGGLEESWSQKYKRSINCNNPKGFSQKAHCAGRKKKNEELTPRDVHKLADKKSVKWDMDADFMAKTKELTGKKHLDDLDQTDLQKVVDWLRTLDEGDLIPLPKGTVKVDVSDVYDWYKLGMHISNLKGLGHHDFGKGPPQTVMAFGSEPEEHKYLKYLNQIGLKTHDIDENFADGKGPGRPGDSQRHGIPKKASLSQLDKIGKGSGRKAQLARWQANMRRGRAKKK